MSRERNRTHPTSLDRRGFFGTVGVAAAGSVLAATTGRADEAAKPPSAALPSAGHAAAETQHVPADNVFVGRTGSDYMVDVLKSLPIDYVTAMPGSTFRALHESLINYGGNRKPELLTCPHEEVAVGMGHGYAKVANKPLATFLHGVVGVQHGSMAIYNAWADRVPSLLIVGNTLALEERRPGVEWAHSAQDNAAMVRDYTKWDDMPGSLEHFGESTVRAYRMSVTPPCAPTLIVADGVLQEREVPPEPIALPRYVAATPPCGDPNALRQAAALLAAAASPVIIVDRLVRSREGMKALVDLAEALQAPVIDKGGRMNMPTRHPLNHSFGGKSLLAKADVVLGLEVWDLYGAVHSYDDRVVRSSRDSLKPTAKLISIGAGSLLSRANLQDFQRDQVVDLDITGDGETTLPFLLEAVRSASPGDSASQDRAGKLRSAWAASDRKFRESATYAWTASPISVARVVAVLGKAVEHEDWALVSPPGFQSYWPMKLWNFDKPYQHIGSAGGFGVGYSAPSSVGAALAHRDAGRLAVSIIGDGELFCAPGALWTAAHHGIPILMIVHNNRGYHQEIMHIQRMADRHARGVSTAGIGTTLANPNVDFAKLADSMGVWAKGPIEDPADLAPALRQAVAEVKQGRPALLDVVMQGR